MTATPKAALLSRDEIVACLVKASCIGTVKMSYESGPYDITRPSINASRLYGAVEAAILAKLQAATPAPCVHPSWSVDEDGYCTVCGGNDHATIVARPATPAEPAQAVELPDERAAFERAMRDEHGWGERDFRAGRRGEYIKGHAASAWLAWQARAALSGKGA